MTYTTKRTKIFVAGTFDLIHVGHIRFLKAAKELAQNSELIVVVARDKTVQKIKGRSPVFNEQERLEIIQNLKPVDQAILGNEEGHLFDILLKIKPDIIALGYDQKVSESALIEWGKKYNLNFKVIRLPKFDAHIDSSTKIRRILCQK